MKAAAKFGKALNEMSSAFSDAGRIPIVPVILAIDTLNESIEDEMPIKLFRLQSFTERNINDIKRSLVHMSTPDMFNDIYDSEPILDIQAIEKRMRKQITPEKMLEAIECHRSHPIALANRKKYEDARVSS